MGTVALVDVCPMLILTLDDSCTLSETATCNQNTHSSPNRPIASPSPHPGNMRELAIPVKVATGADVVVVEFPARAAQVLKFCPPRNLPAVIASVV